MSWVGWTLFAVIVFPGVVGLVWIYTMFVRETRRWWHSVRRPALPIRIDHAHYRDERKP